MSQEYIEIRGARENNLKNVSLRIPKRKITIFTGVSGSGKSSIVFDTVATEAQRQMNENFSMFIRTFLPRYSQPDADAIENLSMADRRRPETAGRRIAFDHGHDHRYLPGAAPVVFPHRQTVCGTCAMSSPSTTRKGMCPNCNGLGRKLGVDLDLFLDKSKSLNEGAILFPEYAVDSLGLELPGQSKLFDMDKKLSKFSEKEMDLLLYSKPYKVKTNVGGKDLQFNLRRHHRQIYGQVHHARREDHVGTHAKDRRALHHDGAVHGLQRRPLQPGSAEVQDQRAQHRRAGCDGSRAS